jgi:membrane protein YdbS with pleckstrin-like domain
VISVTMSFQLAYIVLLYAGIALQQVSISRNESIAGFSMIMIIFLVVVLLVILPLQVIRIRRARRYAREHAVEIDSPAPTPAT